MKFLTRMALVTLFLGVLPHGLRAQAGATEDSAQTKYKSIPRSQRPAVMVTNFDFASVLSDQDREEMNSLTAFATALKGGDPLARQTQSNTNLGKAIADLLMANLLETHQFRVLERKMLEELMKEQNLAASNRAAPDASSIAAKAKLLGAKYLITGSITKFGHETKSKGGAFGMLKKVGGAGISENSYTVGLAARIVDTSTGEVVASVTSDGEVKGGKKFGIGGFGGGAGGLFGSSSSGEKEKKIGEAVQAAVGNLVDKLVERREAGDIEP